MHTVTGSTRREQVFVTRLMHTTTAAATAAIETDWLPTKYAQNIKNLHIHSAIFTHIHCDRSLQLKLHRNELRLRVEHAVPRADQAQAAKLVRSRMSNCHSFSFAARSLNQARAYSSQQKSGSFSIRQPEQGQFDGQPDQ